MLKNFSFSDCCFGSFSCYEYKLLVNYAKCEEYRPTRGMFETEVSGCSVVERQLGNIDGMVPISI